MIFPAAVAGKILCKKRSILLGLVKESRTVSAVPPKADIPERGHVPANGEKRTPPELFGKGFKRVTIFKLNQPLV